MNNLCYADDMTLMAESEEELKSFLMRVKEDSEKAGLKLNMKKKKEKKAKNRASSRISSCKIEGENLEAVRDFIFLGSQITAYGSFSSEMKRWLFLERQAMVNIDGMLKSWDIILPTKFYIFKTMVFPVVIYGCEYFDHKEGWILKNWYFWTVVLEKTLDSPLDCKEIQPVNPKGNQPSIFIGRTDAEAETPVFWLLGGKSQLTGKDPDAGKN